MQPEAEGSSSCKASTVMERATLVLTVLLTFGATYFATAYTVYIDFFKALLLGVDTGFWKSITLPSLDNFYWATLCCIAMQSGVVRFLHGDLSSEAQFKTSKYSQILYKYSVKSLISIKVEWTICIMCFNLL